jgi:hypothetical protein
MDFRINCECGKRIFVTTGSAGGTVRCECGRTVTVPLLSELRRQNGLPAYQVNPARVIEQMLAAGELPRVGPCARCGNPTDEVLDAVAECETSWAGQSVHPGGRRSASSTLLSWGFPLSLWKSRRGRPREGISPFRSPSGCAGAVNDGSCKRGWSRPSGPRKSRHSPPGGCSCSPGRRGWRNGRPDDGAR